MFNLIVAVLSIALIGITAGASVYYGGTAFSNSNNRGQVSSLISAGGQIGAAQSLHRTERGGVPATKISSTNQADNTLISLNYLQAQPSVPSGLENAGSWEIVDGGALAVLKIDTSVGDTAAKLVCEKLVEEGGAYLKAGVTNADADDGEINGIAAAADITTDILAIAERIDVYAFGRGGRVNFACIEADNATTKARYFAYRI